MSHSKFNRRGHSLYIENWNPYAKKFINVCILCGKKGYRPSIKEEGFCNTSEKKAIFAELTSTYKEMGLDELGRCEDCARIQDGLMKDK